MSDKIKYPAAQAREVANEIITAMAPFCWATVAAGSLRREKETVGDVEILYIPKISTINGLLGVPEDWNNRADERIQLLLDAGILCGRLNKRGHAMWGARNKLALHVGSGIPVDLFSTTEPCWFNYLVCRTGGKQNNIDIANGARGRGLKWNPYGEGFRREDGTVIPMRSEQEVYTTAGLEYREPKDRL